MRQESIRNAPFTRRAEFLQDVRAGQSSVATSRIVDAPETESQPHANSPLTAEEKDFLDYIAEQLVKKWFEEQDERPAEE